VPSARSGGSPAKGIEKRVSAGQMWLLLQKR
jgi:hypothetical protein